MFNNMPLLVALDREHTLIAPAVVVVSDGALKGGMEPFKPILKDVVETDQQRCLQIARFKSPEQLHQVEAAAPIPTGLDHHVALGVDREIGISPAIQAIQLSAARHRPGLLRSGQHHGEPLENLRKIEALAHPALAKWQGRR